MDVQKCEVAKAGETKENLQKLARFHLESFTTRSVAEELVICAFHETKPLFCNGTEKLEAAELLEKSLPLLESFLWEFILSLEDHNFRQYAQECRSGLQFLVDEFLDEQSIYEKLKSILLTDPVHELEEFIENTKGMAPEYLKFSVDYEKIPESHKWWYLDGDIRY